MRRRHRRFATLLLWAFTLTGCQSDADRLAKLRQRAETSCSGLQSMRAQFDSVFGYWMVQNPDTLVPVMAVYGDSLKHWYDQCEVAVQNYNQLKHEIGVAGEDMTIPAAP